VIASAVALTAPHLIVPLRFLFAPLIFGEDFFEYEASEMCAGHGF